MDADTYDPWQQTDHSTKPLLLEQRSSKLFILIVVATAVFTDTFFYTLIIPILPDLLEDRAGIPPQKAQQWISILLSTYALTNLITSPIAGFIMDRSGSRKPALLTGLLAMVVSTTLFAFGRTPTLLLVGRALQGVSAAIIRVGGLALITDTFEAGKSGSAMGWQSVGMFLGTFTGPSISGILYDNFGMVAVFGVAYSVLGVDILLRVLMIERKEAAQWEDRTETSDIDETTALIPQSSDTQLESGMLQRDEDGNVRATKTRRFPILILLEDRRLLTVLWATFACAAIMTALESVVPLYTMELFSWTPSQTGLLIIALSISIVLDPALGSLADRYGSRWLSVIGFVAVAFVYSVAVAITHDSKRDKIGLCILLVILGFAIGAISTPNMVEVSLLTSAAEKSGKLGTLKADQVMGQAYGALSVAYQLGSLVGPAWGGAVLVTQGWASMSFSFAVLASVSATVAVIFAGE